jgi:hypothetical protein
LKLPTPREEENGPVGPAPHRRKKRIRVTLEEGKREKGEEEEERKEVKVESYCWPS